MADAGWQQCNTQHCDHSVRTCVPLRFLFHHTTTACAQFFARASTCVSRRYTLIRLYPPPHNISPCVAAQAFQTLLTPFSSSTPSMHTAVTAAFLLTPNPLRSPSVRPHTSSACPRACDTTPIENAQLQPPTTLAQTTALATAALSRAIHAGHHRIRINALIPGLNPLIEDTFPYSSQTLQLLVRSLLTDTPSLAQVPDAVLLFPSDGGAAAAASVYSTNPLPSSEHVRTSSFAVRDLVAVDGRVSAHANVLVAPVCRRGDDIMNQLTTVISEAPDAVWILFNAAFDADRAAVGIKEMTRRSHFENSFVNAFYYRGLYKIKRPSLIAVEKGALLYLYPGPWNIFSFSAGKYKLVEQMQHMPTVNDISRILS